MTAMSSRLGLSMYIRAGWPVYGVSKDGVDIVLPNQTRCAIFAGAIFVNFSFSSEISSAYDMLLDAVTETTARVQALHKVLLDQKPKLDADVQDKLIRSAVQNEKLTMGDDGFDELWSAFQKQVEECEIRPRKDADVLSRMGAIKKAFSDFQNASRSFKDSKLRFATQLCIPRLLICINGIDLLYESAGREGAAKNGEIAAIISILTGDETSKVPFDLVVIGSESGIGVPWRQLRNAPKPTEGEKDVLPLVLKQIDRQNIPGPAREHIERRKASTTLNIVAPNDKEAEFDGYIHFARPVSPTEMMICNFPTLAKVLFLLNITSADGRDKIGVHHLEEQGEGSLSRLNVEAQKEEVSELEEIWSQAEVPELGKLAKARNNARARINETLTQAIDELGSEAGLDIERGYLRERYQSKNKVDIDEWHRIRRHLGGNRFCLTILLGAAQHIVEHSRVLLDGAKAAEAFIRHTVDQVRNIGVYQKEDFVLRSVLECYRRYNVLGDYAADVNLHMLLIRHIAVIGTPVSGGVLVRLPEIRDYFAELHSETKISRRRTVAAALKVLCDRGLIFRLSPNANMIETNEAGKGDEATGDQNTREVDARGWPLVLEFRYALHRVVQRHAASHLGQGNVDAIKNNSFAPTLYGSMSSGGPRLSRKSYVFLRRQMVSLSQYPDVPSVENEPNRIPFLENEREGAVQSLRASLSLTRASFSVASISRFADYQRLIPGAEKRGYLETYKVRLRWIIRRAWELQHKDDGFNALYRDEVVWIYNELGVTSLAQGNLTDALALLRQASELNATIEGTQKDGHSSKLISLNHAVVQLERGRLQSARDRLRRIRDTTKPEKGTEFHMALGYLSVLDHLTGRTQELDERFQQVTTHFQSTADKRAAAIFLQHRARFLRNSDPLRSEQFLRTARELAETGGHEDIRNHVQLAEILVSRAKADPHQAVAPELFKKLTDIERFSRHMGIWSLQCDALLLRARMLLEQGETTTSGRLLVRALAIAHRCSLTLRANRGMTLYADLLRHRGDIEGAQTIAIASLEMAKNTGFSLETVRAQAVLSQINP
ncbi:MAG: tetratricopeptide repeat protein [Paracoccaceae bacterium]